MVGRRGGTWVPAALALGLFGCAGAHESEKRLPSPTSAPSGAAVQQITLHVPGMIDRQGIT
jgi:hypothetical protein